MLILRRALEAPTRQIAENSGAGGDVVVEKMRSGRGNFGFDAATGRYVDLGEAGVIDATKVVRLAIENAVSVVGVLLLTKAKITEVREPKPEVSPAIPRRIEPQTGSPDPSASIANTSTSGQVAQKRARLQTSMTCDGWSAST